MTSRRDEPIGYLVLERGVVHSTQGYFTTSERAAISEAKVRASKVNGTKEFSVYPVHYPRGYATTIIEARFVVL